MLYILTQRYAPENYPKWEKNGIATYCTCFTTRLAAELKRDQLNTLGGEPLPPHMAPWEIERVDSPPSECTHIANHHWHRWSIAHDPLPHGTWGRNVEDV